MFCFLVLVVLLMYEPKETWAIAEPNEPELGDIPIVWDSNDLVDGDVDGDYLTVIDDPNYWKAGAVEIGGIEIKRDGENVLVCSASKDELLSAFYNCLKGPETKGKVKIKFTEPNEPEYDFIIDTRQTVIYPIDDITYSDGTIPEPHTSLIKELLDSIPTWPEYYVVVEDINICFDHPDTEFLDMEYSYSKGTKIYKGEKPVN